MEITLQYFDGCPSWQTVEHRLREIAEERGDLQISTYRVASDEDALRIGFRGSPTILVDGRDAFPGSDLPVGLACRVYATPAGLAGAPTSEQLREAIQTG